VTAGRLTRQELGWLLAQEARGAAKMLRKDVTLLTQPPPPEPAVVAIKMPEVRLESTLDMLDDTIGMWSELDAPGSSGGRGRRGRIDLAALMVELLPGASVSLEPGAGTEVFGEETEIRRMLHVLISETNSPGGGRETRRAAVTIRRDHEWVKIAVDLGPDVSASMDLERRWLSRMAVRMGGRLDLERGTMALVLPADASADQSEVADLRKELEQAQQLGEAYARELASVFVASDPKESGARSDERTVAQRRFELLLSLASALHRALDPVFRGLADGLDRTTSADLLEINLSAGQDVLSEIARVAACPATESVEKVDVARALAEAVQYGETRGARQGVRIDLDGPASLSLATKPRALGLLFRALIDGAVTATPRDGVVSVALVSESGRSRVRIRDGGPAVPSRARAELLEHQVDPAAFGRPPGPSVLIAHTVLAYLGGTLRLGDAEDGGAVTEAELPAAT
jgi:hypothetical protein